MKKNLETAIQFYRRAADNGYAGAFRKLGIFYANGDGVKRDLVKAAEYFNIAHNKGDAESTFMLGRCFEKGWGVNKNLNKAMELYKEAASANNVKAIYRLHLLNNKNFRYDDKYEDFLKNYDKKYLNQLKSFWEEQNPHSHFYYAFFAIVALLLIALGPVGWGIMAYILIKWYGKDKFQRF